MFSESVFFLLILFLLAYIGKNQAIIMAVYILLGIKILKMDDKIFPLLESKAMLWGITLITISVLVPIASGEIGFRHLLESAKSYYGWVALAAGIFVAYIAKDGLNLLSSDPHLTTSLVIGTILAVVFFHGVAVGPLIGAGIAYMFIRLIQWFQ